MGVAFPFLILLCVTAQVGWHSAGNIKGRGGRENEIEKNDGESREEERRYPGRRKKRRNTEGRFSIRCLEGLMIMLQLPPESSHWKQLSALLHSHSTKRRGRRDSSLMVDLTTIVTSNVLSSALQAFSLLVEADQQYGRFIYIYSEITTYYWSHIISEGFFLHFLNFI